MGEITRRSPRSERPRTGPSVRVVRGPSHRLEAPDPLPVRLLLGVIVAAGVVGLSWLLGAIGYRLGFASLVRLPELEQSGGEALATGVRLVVAVPGNVFRAGTSQPIWLLLGFLSIAAPAASLAAAKPRVPGGPAMNPVYAALANLGAVFAMLFAALLVWWTGSGVRTDLLGPLPTDPLAAGAWRDGLATAAGLDVLALVAASLWMVLVFRLPIPSWLRALSASATIFTVVLVSVAMAVSGASSAHAGTLRTVVAAEDGGAPALLLGRVGGREAMLRSIEGRTTIEVPAVTGRLRVAGRASIPGFLEAASGGALAGDAP